MNTTALVMSAVSLLVAGLSLGWQVAQWLLSAGRPRATLSNGILGPGGAYVGPVRKNGEPISFDSLRAQGITGEEVIGIQVTNHGRASVVIDRIALCPRGGSARFVPIGECVGPSLPFRLEAGSNVSWYLPAHNADSLVRASRALGEQVSGVYMNATLGTGRSIETPETMRR